MVAGLVVMTGCASISVKDTEVSKKRIPIRKPDLIYVREFDVRHAEFNVDREGDELKEFKELTVMTMTGLLVERMTQHLVPADRLAKVHPPRNSGWIIEGKFLRVNQGSRALRMGVGFGAGGTKMEVEISVYDPSISEKKPFLRFKTTGGSNAQAGAIASTNPAYAVSRIVGSGGHGITEDTERTARMIVASLSEYMAQRGWIDEKQVLHPKREGDWSNKMYLH